MKIFELINAKETLDKICSNQNLPTRTAYSLYIMLSKLNTSFEFFEEKKMEIFKSLGETKDGGYVIPVEKTEDFYKEINKIGELECSEDFEKINISLDIDLGISSAEIALLTPFINFVE